LQNGDYINIVGGIMNLNLLLRDIILIAIGLNIAMMYFSFLLGDMSLLATAGVSLSVLLIAMAIKAYDLFH
tara:strand:+ start:74 stop:286 length:213 start_codon:yes stop_codon:yes gene_type:complete